MTAVACMQAHHPTVYSTLYMYLPVSARLNLHYGRRRAHHSLMSYVLPKVNDSTAELNISVIINRQTQCGVIPLTGLAMYNMKKNEIIYYIMNATFANQVPEHRVVGGGARTSLTLGSHTKTQGSHFLHTLCDLVGIAMAVSVWGTLEA